jgi:hypothetical protein
MNSMKVPRRSQDKGISLRASDKREERDGRIVVEKREVGESHRRARWWGVIVRWSTTFRAARCSHQPGARAGKKEVGNASPRLR